MLLRSSSTPILGSLLSSTPYFSESPNTTNHQPTTLQSFSCRFSPSYHSDSADQTSASSGVRRTRSDNNLHVLLSNQSDDHHHLPRPPPSIHSSSRRPNPPVLETIPSFSIYNSRGQMEEEADLQDQEEEDKEEENNVPLGAIMGGGTFFSFSGEKQDMGGDGNNIGVGSGNTPPLFLARGLGIDRVGSGFLNAGGIFNSGGAGGGGYYPVLTDNNGGNKSDLEMYYKRMVEEDPSNALFLRNYANFLYQTKGDIQRAEEYYSRAILAEPGDGDILSQYAKLVWELHHDEERASSYFKRAVQAAPQDSHVQAAYAGFLWETEDDYDGVGEIDEQSQDNDGPLMVNRESVASGTM